MSKKEEVSPFLFQQVYDYVLNRIERKEWQEHRKIPSIRTMAKELNVHRLTVYKAYQRLKEDKKVYVKEKSGYYVYPNGADSSIPAEQSIITSYARRSRLAEIHQSNVTYQFSEALIDANLLPNHFLSDYVKEIFNLHPKVLGTYSSVMGDIELREALASFLEKEGNFDVEMDHLLITSGAQQAIYLLAEAYIKPRDVILIERPSYSAAIDVFLQKGAQLMPVTITANGYDLEQIEHYMRKYKPRFFYMNPTFHNPTGYTVPTKQRKRLVELAEEYRCLLIEDDTYHDIYFEEPPPASFSTYDTEGYVVYIRSFSKYIAPGLRIAVVLAKSPIMKALVTVKALVDNGSPLLNQKIFLHLFGSVRIHQHLEKLRTALQIRKEVMEEELKKTAWKWFSPNGGLNLWVELPSAIPVQPLLQKSLKQSIAFVPGEICDPLMEMKSWIRLSYSYINEKLQREGLKQFIAIAKTVEKEKR